jgi:hypothetical protein
MPFGGHQQVCKSWFLSRLPYFHLLPESLYSRILEMWGEPPARIKSLLATKRTGIGIVELEDLVIRSRYQILSKRTYLLNPMYGYRFKLPSLRQLSIVTRARFMQDFVTSCAYLTIQPA